MPPLITLVGVVSFVLLIILLIMDRIYNEQLIVFNNGKLEGWFLAGLLIVFAAMFVTGIIDHSLLLGLALITVGFRQYITYKNDKPQVLASNQGLSSLILIFGLSISLAFTLLTYLAH